MNRVNRNYFTIALRRLLWPPQTRWPLFFELLKVAEIKADRHKEREKLILTLRNMAKTNAGVEALFRGKSIPELVALLDHPNPKGHGSLNYAFRFCSDKMGWLKFTIEFILSSLFKLFHMHCQPCIALSDTKANQPRKVSHWIIWYHVWLDNRKPMKATSETLRRCWANGRTYFKIRR